MRKQEYARQIRSIKIDHYPYPWVTVTSVNIIMIAQDKRVIVWKVSNYMYLCRHNDEKW